MAPRSRSAKAVDVAGAPSGQRLFNIILVLRWIALAVASASYVRNLGTQQLDFGTFVPLVSVLTIYTAVLSLYPDYFHELNAGGPALLVFDYAVSFMALALAGTVWSPFLVFVVGSLLFWGLRGTVRSGVLAALTMTVLYAGALVAKGVTPTSLVYSGEMRLAIIYVMEFWIFSVAWAYAAGLASWLGDASGQVAESRDRLVQANAEMGRRSSELLALESLRRTLVDKQDIDMVLASVLDALGDIGHHGARIWLCEGGDIRLFRGPGCRAEAGSVPGPRALDAIRDRKTVALRVDASGCELEGETGGFPGIALPIAYGDEILGALEVLGAAGVGFGDEETRFLDMFCDQIALAIRHIRLAEEASEYAVTEERNRIAVQLHRTVVSHLEEASALAGSAAPEGLSVEARTKLARVGETLASSLRDLRVAVLNWRSLEWGSGVLELARRYVQEFTTMSAVPVRLAWHGAERPLGSEKAKDLLRILQEALSNVLRHAEAHAVEVDLDFSPTGVTMSVRDDGCGYDPAEVARRASIGLNGMRRRGNRHGGEVSLSGTPGRGSEVRVWLPC